MQAPRLEEDQARTELNPVQPSEMLRALAEWIQDLLHEKPEPDTSIDWEDGEEHDAGMTPPAP